MITRQIVAYELLMDLDVD